MELSKSGSIKSHEAHPAASLLSSSPPPPPPPPSSSSSSSSSSSISMLSQETMHAIFDYICARELVRTIRHVCRVWYAMSALDPLYWGRRWDRQVEKAIGTVVRSVQCIENGEDQSIAAARCTQSTCEGKEVGQDVSILRVSLLDQDASAGTTSVLLSDDAAGFTVPGLSLLVPQSAIGLSTSLLRGAAGSSTTGTILKHTVRELASRGLFFSREAGNDDDDGDLPSSDSAKATALAEEALRYQKALLFLFERVDGKNNNSVTTRHGQARIKLPSGSSHSIGSIKVLYSDHRGIVDSKDAIHLTYFPASGEPHHHTGEPHQYREEEVFIRNRCQKGFHECFHHNFYAADGTPAELSGSSSSSSGSRTADMPTLFEILVLKPKREKLDTFYRAWAASLWRAPPAMGVFFPISAPPHVVQECIEKLKEQRRMRTYDGNDRIGHHKHIAVDATYHRRRCLQNQNPLATPVPHLDTTAKQQSYHEDGNVEGEEGAEEDEVLGMLQALCYGRILTGTKEERVANVRHMLGLPLSSVETASDSSSSSSIVFSSPSSVPPSSAGSIAFHEDTVELQQEQGHVESHPLGSSGSDTDASFSAYTPFLFPHTDLLAYLYLLQNVTVSDYTCHHWLPDEVKYAVCSRILGPSGRAVECRFFYSSYKGSYPRVYIKCVFSRTDLPAASLQSKLAAGAQSVRDGDDDTSSSSGGGGEDDSNHADTTSGESKTAKKPNAVKRNGVDMPAFDTVMDLFSGGFGRVEIDIAPTVSRKGFLALRASLGLPNTFPMSLLWNVVAYACVVFAECMQEHLPSFLAGYASTFTDDVESTFGTRECYGVLDAVLRPVEPVLPPDLTVPATAAAAAAVAEGEGDRGQVPVWHQDSDSDSDSSAEGDEASTTSSGSSGSSMSSMTTSLYSRPSGSSFDSL